MAARNARAQTPVVGDKDQLVASTSRGMVFPTTVWEDPGEPSGSMHEPDISVEVGGDAHVTSRVATHQTCHARALMRNDN